MRNLIKFELRKLSKFKPIYILLLVAIVLLLLSLSTTIYFKNHPIDSEFVCQFSYKDFFYDEITGIPTIMIVIFVTLFALEDYTSFAIKNVISKGYNRISIFFAKYIVSLIAFLGFLTVFGLVSYVLGYSFLDHIETTYSNYYLSLTTSIIVMLALHAIYYVIAINTQKIGLSIAFCLIFPTIIKLLIAFFDYYIIKSDFELSKYWIMNIYDNLYYRDIIKIKDYYFSINCSIFYLLISLTLGALIYKRKDI